MSVTLKSGEKIAALKQGIEGVTGETYTDLTEAVNGLKEKQYDAGKKAEYDVFWDEFQNKGAGVNYRYAFAYSRFADKTFRPKYNIVTNTNNSSARDMFYYDTMISEVPVDIVLNTNNLTTMFSNATKMRKIKKIVFNVAPTTLTSMFEKAENLEEVTFEGEKIGVNGLNLQWSTKLNHDSIESIINALSPTTSGLTVTLSKTAKEAAFTEEEWAELVATKPNWTISLA